MITVKKSLLAFDTCALRKGQRATLKAVPLRAFRGERLLIPDSQARYYVVADIRVKGKAQLLNQNAIPATCFSELAVDANACFAPLGAGDVFEIDVICTGRPSAWVRIVAAARRAAKWIASWWPWPRFFVAPAILGQVFDEGDQPVIPLDNSINAVLERLNARTLQTVTTDPLDALDEERLDLSEDIESLEHDAERLEARARYLTQKIAELRAKAPAPPAGGAS